MPVMPFEGLCVETLEDVYGEGIITEDTHTAEDEAFYCDSILSGEYDDSEQDFGDWAEDTYDPDFWEADAAQNRWERNFWGD